MTFVCLFVLTFEIWFISPYAMMDFILVTLCVITPFFNFLLVYFTGYLKENLNKQTRLVNGYIAKIKKSNERIIEYLNVTLETNNDLKIIVGNKPELFPPKYLEKLGRRESQILDLIKDLSKHI